MLGSLFCFFYCKTCKIVRPLIRNGMMSPAYALISFTLQRYAQPHWAHGGCLPWGQSTRTPGLRQLTGVAVPVSGQKRSQGLWRGQTPAQETRRSRHGEPSTPTPCRSMTRFYTWTGSAEPGGETVSVRSSESTTP